MGVLNEALLLLIIWASVISCPPNPGNSLTGSCFITFGFPIIFILFNSLSLKNDPLNIFWISVWPSGNSAGLRTIVCASTTVWVVVE